MSKPINEPRMVQQALVSDEDLSFELAALVPTANGITNAASTFIDKATKLLLSDKIMLTDEQHTAVTSAIAIAQLTVKEGAAISKLLRNPDASAEVIAGLRLTSEDRQDALPASLDAASASPPDWTRRSPAATGTRTKPNIRRRGIPPTPKSS